MTTSRISDAILDQNIQSTIADISTQIRHAQSVNNRARAGYYKIAALLSASIIDALLYHLIEKKCAASPSLWSVVKISKATKLHKLPEIVSGNGHTLWVTEYREVSFTLKGAMLNDMNDFCLKTDLISPRHHSSIVYVRDKRNEIHLQGLNSTSRQFNGHMVERINKVANQLYDRL